MDSEGLMMLMSGLSKLSGSRSGDRLFDNLRLAAKLKVCRHCGETCGRTIPVVNHISTVSVMNHLLNVMLFKDIAALNIIQTSTLST